MDKAKGQVRISPALLIIIGLSFVIKLLLFLFFYHGSLSQITMPDSATYLAPAKFLLTTGQYLASPHSPMFFRTPGYPTFIAALFWLFGEHLSVIIIAQLVINSMLILLAYLIANRLFSRTVAYIAAVIVALNFLYFGYSLMILTETLFCFFISLVFLSGVYLFSNNSRQGLWAFCLGFFLALATLVRPASYYLIVPILVGSVIYGIKSQLGWFKLGRVLLLLLLPTLIFVGGWQIRNKMLHKHICL